MKNKSEELKAALEQAYPGKTSTQYVDLLINPRGKESPLGKLLATKEEPSPLVVIDGVVQVPVIFKEVGAILNS